MDDTPMIGRLALREEGDDWNAYYAFPDTMQDAVPLGSIKMRFVRANEDCKVRFIHLMREIVGDIIEATIGVRPVWGDPQGAPEAERSGRA